MKIKSTGIANMKMQGEISNIFVQTEQSGKYLIMDIRITKPRNWDVVISLSEEDINILRKKFLSFSIIGPILGLLIAGIFSKTNGGRNENV